MGVSILTGPRYFIRITGPALQGCGVPGAPLLTSATHGQDALRAAEPCHLLPGSLGKAQGLDGGDAPTNPKQIKPLWYLEGKRPRASAEPDRYGHSSHPLFRFPDEDTEAQKEGATATKLEGGGAGFEPGLRDCRGLLRSLVNSVRRRSSFCRIKEHCSLRKNGVCLWRKKAACA